MRTWVVAAAVLLAGCTSSGGISAPSLSTIESALHGDATVKQALARLENNVKAQGLAYACIAKALVRDADTSDLVAFAAGRKPLSDFADSTISTDLRTCASTALRQATGS